MKRTALRLATVLTIIAGIVAPIGIPVARAGNQVCHLVAPADPTSAAGLSTPWQVAGCNENDPNNAVFVQAVIFDPATATLSVYNPLVVTAETSPAVPPTVPILPANAVVAIWVGANNTVQVVGPSADSWIQPGGQQAYLGVPTFDAVINAAHSAIPPLGTAKDGLPCPTSRDFSIVDQDPSDNTTARELVTPAGIAQNTPTNRALYPGAPIVFNGSDEATLDRVDTALGCTPWKVPDLADPTHTQRLTAGLLQELQAAAYQAAPVALVPGLDPFTLINGQPNLNQLNLYRAQVDQPSAADTGDDGYCSHLLAIGEPRLKLDQPWTSLAGSPFPALADNLYTFLAYRFTGTWALLNCSTFTGQAVPVTLTYNGNGVVTSASYN